MLGHIKPRLCGLSPSTKTHYQRLYCSLCYSLRQQFGLLSSFFISHELTLSLAALPLSIHENIQEQRCPASLFYKHKKIISDSSIDKAAQLSVLLVWLKLLDSETDKPALYKTQLRLCLDAKIPAILHALSFTTQQFIQQYILLIRANHTDFKTTTNMSGLLALHIFEELPEKKTALNIAHVAGELGELITLEVALMDVQKDSQEKQFNPILLAAENNQTTIQQEYRVLKQQYSLAVNTIRRELNPVIQNEYPIFSEILQQSLQQLSRRIAFTNRELEETDPKNEERLRRINRKNNRGSDCCSCLDCCYIDCCNGCLRIFEKCGDCFDCFSCDCDCLQCCSHSPETSGECCDAGACDCSGCDCSV
jgi:hypothetical protein